MKQFELSDETLAGRLRSIAEIYPDDECLICPDSGSRMSYAQFDRMVDDYSCALIKLGIAPEMKVGLWAPNCLEWVIVAYAAARVGAILVPLNVHYKLGEIKFAISDAGIHTLFIAEGTRKCEYVEMLESLIPEIKYSKGKKWHSKLFPELNNIVIFSDTKYDGMINFYHLSGNNVEKDRKWLDARERLFDCNSVATLQYTSGTTGTPKGVLLTHRNMLNNALSYLSFNEDRCTALCFLPLFHSYGFVAGMISTISNGSRLVVMKRFTAVKAAKVIQDEKCTKMYGVPAMFRSILEEKDIDKYDLSSLEICISGGACCESALIYAFKKKFRCIFLNGYGITETSPIISLPHRDDDLESIATSVGRPLPLVDVRIIDSNTGDKCPPGVNGEICIKGFNVMKGYYRNEKATAEAIDKYGYYHSGDIGYMDKDGFIHITGRIKDMIIRAGENIYPREIEEFLCGIPSIEHVEVVGVDSKINGEVVAAFVRLRPGCYLTEQGIINYCTGNIAAYKIPRYIFFVNEFPLTSTGKVRKNILRETANENVKKMR